MPPSGRERRQDQLSTCTEKPLLPESGSPALARGTDSLTSAAKLPIGGQANPKVCGATLEGEGGITIDF